MGQLKARVERLNRSPLGDAASLRRHWVRVRREKRAAFFYFLRAIPAEVEDRSAEIVAALEPWLDAISVEPYLPDEAPLIARIACGIDWNGWFPSPLPPAWVRAVLDHPTADDDECGNCGLAHPSGGYSWKDGRPVFAPPHFPHCLHCGEPMGEVDWGKVAEGYYQRHKASHPYPVLGLGKFLLSGGDPNQFDPLRRKA